MLSASIELNLKQIKQNLKKLHSFEPFFEINNLIVICKNFDCTLLTISLKKSNELDWIGIMFLKNINNQNFLFSGGRFGFSGFKPIKGKLNLQTYFEVIEESLDFLNLSSISFSVSFLYRNFKYEEKNNWSRTKLNYFVAETKDSVSNKELIFKKTKVNSIKKILKKIDYSEFSVDLAKGFNELENWYYGCYSKRMNEIDGKFWELNLFKDFFELGTGELFLVRNKDKKIVGGSFVLVSKEILEIFMIATEKEFIDKGINYLLAYNMYIFSEKKKIAFINWQASNPPNGNISFFKKRWNSLEEPLNIFSKKFKPLKLKYLQENFSNLFIYPYELL